MLTPLTRTRRAVAGPVRLLHAASALAAALLGAPAHAGSSGEWLSSTDGPSPIVSSKSGAGSAQASATAKVTSESIKTLCADQARGNPAEAKSAMDACSKQWQGELGKTYTVRADCTVGRLDPLDGKSYVLDGLWDNSDVGAGRTRWRGPDGVVGRDGASGGLALSQQWEVLCPGRVSASVLSKARNLSPAGGSGGGAPAAAASVCGGDPSCTEVSGFAMSVVEFRASLQGAWKVLTTTLRFRNKLNRPLVLGYVVGSGGATDDRGNRYVVKDGDIRGIGLITQRADDKFVVSPGQTADARFTLVWGGQGLFGNTFDLDLTIREITQVGNGQTTLGPGVPAAGRRTGRRSALRRARCRAGLGNGACRGLGRCDRRCPSLERLPAGVRRSAARADRHLTVRRPGIERRSALRGGRELSRRGLLQRHPGTDLRRGQRQEPAGALLSPGEEPDRPAPRARLQGGTNAAVDEQGNRYAWGRPGTNDGSAQGIGTIEGARIDPRLQLAPGATRDVQMVLTRSDAGSRPVGRTFTLDTVLVELRGSGAQWQKGRENPVHLAAPGAGVTPAVGQTPVNDQVQKASDLVRGLLGGK